MSEEQSLGVVRKTGGVKTGAQGGKLLRGVAFAEFRNLQSGKMVTTLVVGMTGVAFEPFPRDAVGRGQLVELAPEVVVLHGLTADGTPASGFPEPQPLGDAFAEVLGVGEDLHFAGFPDGRESGNGGLEFHAIVGRGGFAAGDLANETVAAQDGRPATGAWIALARAVGMDHKMFHEFNVMSATVPKDVPESCMAVVGDAKRECEMDTESPSSWPRQDAPNDFPQLTPLDFAWPWHWIAGILDAAGA